MQCASNDGALKEREMAKRACRDQRRMGTWKMIASNSVAKGGHPVRKLARATNRGGAALGEIFVDRVISKRANRSRLQRVARHPIAPGMDA
jgi:hypothetical protein